MTTAISRRVVGICDVVGASVVAFEIVPVLLRITPVDVFVVGAPGVVGCVSEAAFADAGVLA